MFEKIVITTHGVFSEALKNSAEMIIGTQKDIEVCPYLEGMSLEHLQKDLKEKIGDKKTLVLVDLFGGTPCNVAMGLMKSENIALITGVNLALLIEAVMNLKQLNEQELLGYLQKIHIQSLKQFYEKKEVQIYGCN